jgi:hypothetical protein
MENAKQTTQDILIYNSFTIVFFHLFDLVKGSKIASDQKFIKPVNSDIDSQIFDLRGSVENQLIKRYQLKGFDMKVTLYDTSDSPTISVHVHVEAAVFYDSTISLTYRLMVKQSEKKEQGYTTDDLITIAGLLLGNEHWNAGQNPDSTSIDTDVANIVIENLLVNEDGSTQDEAIRLEGKKEIFRDVLIRYKHFVTANRTNDVTNDLYYMMADVWEDIEHTGFPEFKKITEAEVISHIYDHHKSELMGLFTLYPEEWIYRNPVFFDDICGGNIAIDTDDLVLCNENICVVFGTYGRRGGEGTETDWMNHLKIRESNHVSWPEYMAILELLLARKQFLGKLHQSIANLKPDETSDLATITRKSLEVNYALLKMDVLKFSRYCSHRHMYRKTAERLKISEEFAELTRTSECIENQINNLKSIKEKKESAKLTGLLAVISCVAIFQIFFCTQDIPIIKEITGNPNLGKTIAYGITYFCAFLVSVGIFLSVKYIANTIRKR